MVSWSRLHVQHKDHMTGFTIKTSKEKVSKSVSNRHLPFLADEFHALSNATTFMTIIFHTFCEQDNRTGIFF